MEIRIELNDLQINPVQLSPELWAKPEYSGFANVDITQGQLPGAPISPLPPTAPIGHVPGGTFPGQFR
jgi:hypothetical protein